MRGIFLAMLSIILLGCSSSSKLDSKDLIGAWYFIDGDSYYELHFDTKYILLHNEILGSKIHKYEVAKELIKSLNNDKVIEEYRIISLSENSATMIIQGRTVDLLKIQVDVDIPKILDSNTDYYLSFTNEFRKRECKYSDASLQTL